MKQEAVESFQNASVKEVFVAILRALRDQSKKIKVHSSKYLKQLESFLFKVNTKKITEEEFRLLLLGNEEKQLPFGLLACCGSKSKVDGNLRKSAYFTVKLLVQILDQHPQRREFIALYADLEEDEFKLMNLSTHILSDNQNDMAAYKLIKFVKDKRSHISLQTIIDGRRVQERFENWYKDQKKVQVEEDIKQTTWNEGDNKRQTTEDDALRDQRDEKRKKKKKLLEHIQLNQADKSVSFLISTFQDPLSLEMEPEQQGKGKSKHRESSQKRKQISNLMTLAVNTDGNIEIVRQKLNKKGLKLEDLIIKLHIDSEEFDPYVLIQSLHSDTPNAYFVKVITRLQEAYKESRTMNQSLMYFFFEDLFVLSNGISKLHNEFVKREYAEIQQRKNQQDHLVDEDDLILGRLKHKNRMLSEQLNGIASNLNSMKKNQFQLRQCLVFLQKFEGLVKLPQEIKKAYVQKDYKQVVFKYQQNKLNIEKFKSLSIFLQLFQEINTNLRLSFEDMLNDIKHETSDFQKLSELVSGVLDLPVSLIAAEEGKLNTSFQLFLKDNKLEKEPIIHPNAILVVQSIATQLMSEASQYLENEQTATLLQPDKLQAERMQGDMISEFLGEMGIVVKKAERKKAGRKAVVLNCKAVEKYFHNKFLTQFTNFYSLCVKFQSGDFDYRMGFTKSSEEPGDQRYAAGNSRQWSGLISMVFKELVDQFLNGFGNFQKRLQENWFQDDDVGKESSQFYARVKSDMQSMSSVLYHYEQILLATKYQASDSTQQRILERTKQIKTEMQVLFMKILFEEFRNITLNQLSLQDASIPQADFFGVQVSDYILAIFDAIQRIFHELGNFALHEGLYISNKDIFCQYLSQLVQQSLNKVKQIHLSGTENVDPEQRLMRRTRCLVFMHNLRMLQPKSPCNLLPDLIDQVYKALSFHIGRQSQFSTNMTRILNSLNRRQSRRQSRLSIASLYGAPMTPEKFAEICTAQLSSAIDAFYTPTLQLYIQQLAPDFIAPDTKSILPAPRPYLYDWLELINQQVAQAALLIPVNTTITDSIIAYVITRFLSMVEHASKNQPEPRKSQASSMESSEVSKRMSTASISLERGPSLQTFMTLTLELQFFEQMTAKMHGRLSKEGFDRVYASILQKSELTTLDALFTAELDVQARQDLLRNSRYKAQFNFKGLFAYF